MNSDTSMPSPESVHISVLLNEAVDALAPKAGGRYLDGTVGMGGHSFAIMERTGGEGFLCGLDRDRQALELARIRLAPFGDRVHLVHTRYSEFEAALDGIGWDAVDGALIDIGVSSLQIDSAERGFSFSSDGPLDMRMDRDSEELPVSRLVNRAKLGGSEGHHRTLRGRSAGRAYRAGHRGGAGAQAHRNHRGTGGSWWSAPIRRAWRAKARNHPATRTFQALRMAVNDEIGELERFLDAILGRLKPGGRVAVISFHSLEDRVVKHRMKAWAQGCICPKHIPVCVCHHAPEALLVTQKPVCPSERELMLNPRAGSAKLRVAEKLDPHARQADEDSGEEAARLRYEAKRAARLARHGREGRERA